MTWADTQAVQTVIESVPALAVKTFVSVTTPNGVKIDAPYVVIHPSDGVDDTDRVTGPRVTEHPDFTLHVVGASAEQTQIMAGLVKAKFVTGGRFTPPVVVGRRNGRGYWRSPVPLQVDTALTPAVIYQVVELGWVSDPA